MHGVTTTALVLRSMLIPIQNEVTVSLAEGKVQVEFDNEYNGFQDQYLVAGEQLAYNRDLRTIKKVFQSKNKCLERWYFIL